MASLKRLVLTVSLVAVLLGASVYTFTTPTSMLAGVASAPGGSVLGPSFEHVPLIKTGIIGNVSIGPMLPDCAVNLTIAPVSSITIKVVATAQAGENKFPVISEIGEQTFIPVRWSDGCSLWGTFQTRLMPGTYTLTLSYCLDGSGGAGCEPLPGHLCAGSCFLPIWVVVEPGRLTPVIIGIDTGIE